MASTEKAINMLSMNVYSNKGKNVDKDDHAFKFKLQIQFILFESIPAFYRMSRRE